MHLLEEWWSEEMKMGPLPMLLLHGPWVLTGPMGVDEEVLGLSVVLDEDVKDKR